MAQHKTEEERRRIQEERARLLREEKRLFEEEKERMKENEEENDGDLPEMEEEKKPNRLNRSFAEFDILAKKREEEELEMIRRERQFQLQEERRMFREAKKLMEDDKESEDGSVAPDPTEPKKPQKLSKSFTEFDVLEKKRKEEERNRAFEEKLKILEEEKKSFAIAKRQQEEEESDSQDGEKLESRSVSQPSRLSSKLTNFEETEKQRIEKERMAAQERKIQEMEEELLKFQEERKNMNESDIEEKSEIPSPQVKQPRPKKLSTNFTKFDEIFRMKQEEERRRMKEQKEKELENERRMFIESRQAEESNSDEEVSRISESPVNRPISKMNVRQQMQSVLRAQEEMEQKRIMETKFCRMTVEQQEMFLAREKRLQMLQEKLAQAEAEYEEYGSCSSEYTEDDYSDEEESEEFEQEEEDPATPFCLHDDPGSLRDDNSTPGSNDSGYTGAPWFTETLTNITLTEGDPVRFDALIHADPHPKVTWYFKNRLIRNSPDYQYMNKGTQYSLYMNESFVDDMGEYMCKAENSKGIATSKAILTVIDKDD